MGQGEAGAKVQAQLPLIEVSELMNHEQRANYLRVSAHVALKDSEIFTPR